MGYLTSWQVGIPALPKALVCITLASLSWGLLGAQSFKESFESGFDEDHWVEEGSGTSTSSSYSLSGRKSFRSLLKAQQSSNPRSEIRFLGGNGTPNFHPNGSTWGVKFAIYFPSDFKPDNYSSDIIAQFHAKPDPGDTYLHPTWALRVRGRSLSVSNRSIEKRIGGYGDESEHHWTVLRRIQPGKWHYFIVDIHWDYRSNGNGFMRTYVKVGSPPGNSDRKINFKGPTGYNDRKGSFFKLGVYKWDWKDRTKVNRSKLRGVGDRILYYDDFEIKKNGFGPAAVTNKPPKADAGPDVTVNLPINSVKLKGTASDPENKIKSIKWIQKSGPSGAKINDDDEAIATVSRLKEGKYVFELQVTDDKGAKDQDRMVLVVEAPENEPPTAKAGPDITITLPTNRVTVEGDVSDPDNNIKSIKWTQKSGPSAANLEDADKATVKISNLKEGRYAFELLVTDKDGERDTDRVVIYVEPPENLPPVAKAGPDITLTLPTNRVTVEGDASDPDNNIKSIKWTQKSGPSTANLQDADKATVKISNLKEGRYAFELLVTDKDGEKDTDRVVIYVETTREPAPCGKGWT